MIFHTGERIVFIGDSVTEYGHGKPVGEGLFEGVGTGYVRVIENFINIFYPERTIRISNTGISGNNILDLKNRWDTDLLALRHQPSSDGSVFWHIRFQQNNKAANR